MQISIPEPCHENWAEMTPTQQGRHCAACVKTVVDFTHMSDAQVLSHLKKASGNTCGRMRNDQLKRKLVEPIIGGIPRWMSVGLASLAAIVSSTSALGQQIQGEIKPIASNTSKVEQPLDTVDLEEVVVTDYVVDVLESDPTAVGQSASCGNSSIQSDEEKILTFQRFNYSGVVRFVNGEPAAFAEVSFLTPSGKIGHTIMTQEDGKFASFFSSEIASVQVLYAGVVTTQALSPRPNEEIVIVLVEEIAVVKSYRVDVLDPDTTTQGMMVVQRRTPKSFAKKMVVQSYQTLDKFVNLGQGLINKLKSPAAIQSDDLPHGLALTTPDKQEDVDVANDLQVFTLFPNPSNGYVVVKLSDTREGNLLNVFNSTGQLVLSKPVMAEETEVEFNLPASAARGSYIIQLASATGLPKASLKWIVH